MASVPTLWLGRLALHIGMQARGWNGYDRAWLGFSYGSWLPRARILNGWCKGAAGYWLCFHWSIDWWPHYVGWGLR